MPNSRPTTAAVDRIRSTSGPRRVSRRPDHLADALGDADVGGVEVGGPGPVPLDDGARLGQVAEDLAHEERVARRLLPHGPGQCPARFVELVGGGEGQELDDARLVQAGNGQPGDVLVAP